MRGVALGVFFLFHEEAELREVQSVARGPTGRGPRSWHLNQGSRLAGPALGTTTSGASRLAPVGASGLSVGVQ